MDLGKIYYDPEGNERNISWLCTYEPEWAANRIQAGEKVIVQLGSDLATVTEERDQYKLGRDYNQDALEEVENKLTSLREVVRRAVEKANKVVELMELADSCYILKGDTTLNAIYEGARQIVTPLEDAISTDAENGRDGETETG